MSNRMTKAEIRKQLLNLERRALNTNLVNHGCASVVMYHVELDALDEAIKLLDPELHPELLTEPKYFCQECPKTRKCDLLCEKESKR